MNQKDKAAFESWWKSKHDEFNFHGANPSEGWYYFSDSEQEGWEAYQAALTHRDEQVKGLVGALELCKDALDWNLGGEPMGSKEVEAHKAAVLALAAYKEQTK